MSKLIKEQGKSGSVLPIYMEQATKSINLYGESVQSALGESFFLTPSGDIRPLENVTFICFTNRCGSNYFSEVLDTTGFFDNKGEAFNWNRIQDECSKRGISCFHDYVHEVLSPRKGIGSLIKIGWPQLLYLEKSGLLKKFFTSPKYLWVRRRDFLSQAISLHIALVSGKWKSNQASKATNVAYNYKAISKSVSVILQGNEYFLRDFIFTEKPFIEICYEDFCENLNLYLKKVFQFLNLPGQPLPNSELVRVKIQRNELNDKFRQQFLSDIIANDGGGV